MRKALRVALIKQESIALVVEERINGRVILNQQAGHLEPGENLVEMVIREV